jgi:hypothetical protein
VRDAVELAAHGRVDPRMPVAVDVAPERRDPVDVVAPVDVDQLAALGALDDRRVLIGPPLLLRERMPEEAAIGSGEVDLAAR